MELTEREAFRIGFLKRAAERGVTPTEAMQMVKQATPWGALLGAGALFGIGLPMLAGGVTGSIHANIADVDKDDIKRLKKKQLLDALKSETAAIRSRIERRKAKPSYQL